MRVTSVGHAGLFLETTGGSILCDPWVNPAYFTSWFPFPDNSQLDWDQLGNCEYLYISHLHHDHFDAEHLRHHVAKHAQVLLPAFEVPDLEDALRALGFNRFVRTPNDKAVELDGLRVMVSALTSPSDGPLGDSALAVDDGTAVVLNQNDARPLDLDRIAAFAAGSTGSGYDAHFLQFSGAIWYPMVYDLPAGTKIKEGSTKRRNGMERALQYASKVGAGYVFPTAGPPCFLDGELFGHNDLDADPSNVFPDQVAFETFLAERGRVNGRVLIPGSTADLQRDANGSATCTVTHPIPASEVAAIFTDKASYLHAYAERQRAVIAAEKAVWAAPDVDVLTELKAWFDPLLTLADHFREAIGYPVELLVVGDTDAPIADARRQDESVVIDFPAAAVRAGREGERCRYRFRVARPIIERLIADHEIDWVNTLFLSLRFGAHRAGPYNEAVYTWFKCLSLERLEYAEGWYAESKDSGGETVLGDWCVQQRCPHLKADLAHFGVVDGDTLTCRMHGWQWNLASGRCLTSAGHPLRAHPAEPAIVEAPARRSEPSSGLAD